MKLPNADSAIVAREKIVDYLLNHQHPDGAGKARLFDAVGFTAGQWHELADALKDLAKRSPTCRRMDSTHGSKYIVEGSIESPSNQVVNIRSVWIIDCGKQVPRLVTAYPI